MTSVFNRASRTKNAALSSAAGVACNVANILLGFAYRTLFVYVLSAAYLGINGLFSSILTALSLAELGVTTAVTYRFYKPIGDGDVEKVGRLMCFFKWVYRVIALVVLALGLALVPFLGLFIKDASEVPGDVDLAVVYVLFLLQSVASYTYSYRLTILNADQRAYQFSLVQLAITLIKYSAQAAVLLALGDFTLTLAAGVAVTVLANFGFSRWVTCQYREVFAVREVIPREERRQIYSDVRAAFCHKLGTVVLNATDSIVLSSFVGIAATGLYSNYSLIMSGLKSLIGKLLGSFTGSLGNAHATLGEDARYAIYRRLCLANLFVSGVSTACLYVLVDDFVRLWLGGDMLIGGAAVPALCVYFFLHTSRTVNTSFTSGSGLFVKDRARPFIEAAVNVAASVLLVQRMGVAGVFLGTSVSFCATVFWREPYILHRFEFKRPMAPYWAMYASVAGLTAAFCALFSAAKGRLGVVGGWPLWFLELAVCAAAYVALFALVFRRTSEYAYFKNLLSGIFKSRFCNKKQN